MKLPIHDLILRERVIACPTLRDRLRWESRNTWQIIAAIDQHAGRSVPHLYLNEAAYFRSCGCSHPPGPTRSSYFRTARILVSVVRNARKIHAVITGVH